MRVHSYTASPDPRDTRVRGYNKPCLVLTAPILFAVLGPISFALFAPLLALWHCTGMRTGTAALSPFSVSLRSHH
jgi:hypothetical protein